MQGAEGRGGLRRGARRGGAGCRALGARSGSGSTRQDRGAAGTAPAAPPLRSLLGLRVQDRFLKGSRSTTELEFKVEYASGKLQLAVYQKNDMAIPTAYILQEIQDSKFRRNPSTPSCRKAWLWHQKEPGLGPWPPRT